MACGWVTRSHPSPFVAACARLTAAASPDRIKFGVGDGLVRLCLTAAASPDRIKLGVGTALSAFV